MKKRSETDEMREEYDFAKMEGGVRGKYYEAYRDGTNIVVLDPDVADAFPTDEAVNRALRSLIGDKGDPPAGKPPNQAGRAD